uniref:Uncharacterized protein n=1 Tax=Meloidogyne javanica TaxID=6303 RepID=A0A915MA32_MELJA
MKKILSKGGQKFNFNKTEKRGDKKEGFFVDFALAVYDDVILYEDYQILYYINFCYDKENHFKNYCDLDSMSKPIDAIFDDQDLDKLVIFVDQVVNSKGETIINVGNNTQFSLHIFWEDKAIQGNVKNIQKIAKELNALVDEGNIYYLNEECTNLKSEETSTIGLKFKNINTTINVSGKDLADFGYKNKCALGLGIDEENQLKFSSIVLRNYCVLFDTVLNQIAFAPKVVEPKDMEWILCN